MKSTRPPVSLGPLPRLIKISKRSSPAGRARAPQHYVSSIVVSIATADARGINRHRSKPAMCWNARVYWLKQYF
jgi:hypothetical protein